MDQLVHLAPPYSIPLAGSPTIPPRRPQVTPSWARHRFDQPWLADSNDAHYDPAPLPQLLPPRLDFDAPLWEDNWFLNGPNDEDGLPVWKHLDPLPVGRHRAKRQGWRVPAFLAKVTMLSTVIWAAIELVTTASNYS